jgi:hypothetical protein
MYPYASSFLLLLTLLASCQSEQLDPIIDCNTLNISLELVNQQNTGCKEDVGSFAVQATGGEAPYQYSSGNTSANDGVFQGLSAGIYTVIVSDNNGCSDSLNVTIGSTDGVNLQSLNLTESGCGTDDGEIEVIATGGVEPYSYSLDGGAGQSTNVFTNLVSGSYLVKVTDQAGCESTQAVKITSGISYQNSISNIITNNCASASCHGGNQSPNLTTLSNIQNSANRIKVRTGNGTMPPSGGLTQAQIEAIACWVDDGALDN